MSGSDTKKTLYHKLTGSRLDKSSDPVRAAKNELIGILVFIGLVTAIVFSGPMLFGIPIAMYGRKKLRKIDAYLILGASLAYLILYFNIWTIEYFQWYGTVLGLNNLRSIWDPPIAMFVAFSGILLSIAIFYSRSNIFSFDIGKVGRKILRRSEPQEIIESAAIPTADEKALAATVAAKNVLQPIPARASTDPLPEIGSRGFTLGYDMGGAPVQITEKELGTHCVLFGSSGAGKTETIKVITAGLLDLGWSGILLDLKEDTQKGGLLDWCQEYTQSKSRNTSFQHIALKEDTPKYMYNALSGMNSDEASETIMLSQSFDDGYYQALNKKQLNQLITLLYGLNEISPAKYSLPSVYDIGVILSKPDIVSYCKKLVKGLVTVSELYVEDDFSSLIAPDKAMLQAAGGLGARLTGAYESAAGRRLLRQTSVVREEFDITKPGLSYMGLSFSNLPALAGLICVSAMRRMEVYASDVTSGKLKDKKPRFLIIDEARWINRTLLHNLLSSVRSANLSCIICTQGPTDWVSRGGDGSADLKDILQNVNVSILMSQGEINNAELCADILGKEMKLEYTTGIHAGELTDSGSSRTKEGYIVQPEELLSLEVGEALVRVRRPSTRKQWVQVVRRNPTE
jgi:hypothetical protein